MARFVVLLESAPGVGVWLADGQGDPPRTLVESNARVFPSPGFARLALSDARKWRPFADALVVQAA